MPQALYVQALYVHLGHTLRSIPEAGHFTFSKFSVEWGKVRVCLARHGNRRDAGRSSNCQRRARTGLRRMGVRRVICFVLFSCSISFCFHARFRAALEVRCEQNGKPFLVRRPFCLSNRRCEQIRNPLTVLSSCPKSGFSFFVTVRYRYHNVCSCSTTDDLDYCILDALMYVLRRKIATEREVEEAALRVKERSQCLCLCMPLSMFLSLSLSQSMSLSNHCVSLSLLLSHCP